MIATRIMDLVMAEPDGSFTRTIHSFETQAQVDAMRDLLLAQDKPARWAVMGCSRHMIGVWEELYSCVHHWELHHYQGSMRFIGAV